MSVEWKWVENVFTTLPGCDDDFFQRAWKQAKLRYDGQAYLVDSVDLQSARLVAASVRKRQNLYLVYPDFANHRPALTFATALLREWIDSLKFGSDRRPILYFGSTIGIREQLALVWFQNINLATVFPQQHHGRHGMVGASHLGTKGSNLPLVITIYAPADPAPIIEKYKPRWIAVDCGNEGKLTWLRSLLDFAVQRRIPVIAWGQNPFSSCVADFATKAGRVFVWPARVFSPARERSQETLQANLAGNDAIRLQPLVMAGINVEQISQVLHKAAMVLARTGNRNVGQLGIDALRVHWRLLRALEQLSVPLDLYESEVLGFWGLQSFAWLREGCKRFRQACEGSDKALAGDLELTDALLDEVFDILRNADSPLWSALVNLCLEEPPEGEARIITFFSHARRQLFSLAMLAHYNFTEDDLRELRVWITSLPELQQWICQAGLTHQEGINKDGPYLANEIMCWCPLLVGLPSPQLTAKLQPALIHALVGILLYPHQVSTLMHRSKDWSKLLGADLTNMAGVLNQLTGRSSPDVILPSSPRLVMIEPETIEVRSGKHIQQLPKEQFLRFGDPITEVTRLLGDDESAEGDEPILSPAQEVATAWTQKNELVWCESVVEISCEQGWKARFTADDTINVVIRGAAGTITEERYVRALKPGDQVVLIHGQRRQSLYDLIISRVHRHSAIELHLALIRRWQQDFKAAYQRWTFEKPGVRDLNGLLQYLRARGSNLSTSLALSFWLQGETLCPQDPEDLRRVAEVLNMEFVRAHHKRIYRAAERIRGLHRGLANRLNHWLAHYATGLADGHEGIDTDDLIDKELGLSFEDFRNSLLVLRVEAVRTIPGPCLRSDLGLIERSDQP